MYKNKFGELLKKYAEESGIESGSELARMAGLSPATVTRIYTGKQKATPETLEALAPHVGKTYEHIRPRPPGSPEIGKAQAAQCKNGQCGVGGDTEASSRLGGIGQ
jgi:transcriptional regulator with XRE-family HTH domain